MRHYYFPGHTWKNPPPSHTLWWVPKTWAGCSVWELSGALSSKEICGPVVSEVTLFLICWMRTTFLPWLSHRLLHRLSPPWFGNLSETLRWCVISRAKKQKCYKYGQMLESQGLSTGYRPLAADISNVVLITQLGFRLWYFPSIISTLCKEHGFSIASVELMDDIWNGSFSQPFPQISERTGPLTHSWGLR